MYRRSPAVSDRPTKTHQNAEVRDESSDHKAKIDSAVGSQGEPHVLPSFGHPVILRRLRSRDGTRRILSADTDL